MRTPTAVERIREALDQLGPVKRLTTGSYSAVCPSHEDRSPSLSITPIDGSVLLHCHAGCDTADVLAALGMTPADLYDNPKPPRVAGIPAHTTYTYDNGRQVIRSAAKEFRQSGTDNPPELYRLAKVRAAVAAGQPVYVVEGEKDVLALESVGVTATCSPMGAGKWDKIDPSPLYGANVVIVADDDNAGRTHARQVAASLTGHGNDPVVVQAKSGKDAADHVAAGYGVDEFEPIDLPAAAPVGNPTPEHRRTLTLTPASKIRMRRPAWLWDTAPAGSRPQDAEGRIPVGSITIAAGMAGIGKSQFTCWLTAGLTTGTLRGQHYGTPRSVIIAANEDSWEMTIAPRLAAAGAHLDRVFRVDVTDDGSQHARLTLPADTTALGLLIPGNDVALLVCDPLLSALSAEVNDYRGKEVRAALEPLVTMADVTRCAVVGLAHFNKSAPSGDPLLAIQGAAAFGQLIRAAVGFARDETPGEDDEPAAESFVLSTTKNNLGRDNLPSLHYRIAPQSVETDDGTAWVSRFEFTGAESVRSVRDIMRTRVDNEDRDDADDRDEAAEFIRSFLAERGGSALSRDVLKAGRGAGFNDNVMKKARRRAGARTQKRSFGDGWEWTIDTAAPHVETPRCPEGAQGATHADTAPSAPSPAPSAIADAIGNPAATPEPEPARPCGHPGDPTKRCGVCIAEKLASRPAVPVSGTTDCEYCGQPATGPDGFCDADDDNHVKARRMMGRQRPGDAA